MIFWPILTSASGLEYFAHKMKRGYPPGSYKNPNKKVFRYELKQSIEIPFQNFKGGNICLMDDGGPLYKLKCGTMEAECLYGIASYSNANRRHLPRDTVCNAGSYFANVIHFRGWIQFTINNN